jgi:hypothetical protein
MTEVTRGSAPSYPYTGWNFVVIVLDAAFFFAGLAFIDPVVVLPVLVEKLGGSQVTIGLVGGIQRAGWIIPQLVATSFVLHRRRKKPYVMWAVVLSRIPFCFLAVAFTLPWASEHLRLLLFLLIGIYAVFFFGDGLVGVPWHDIIARTIPPNLRGRFFGSINLLGGLFIIGAAAVVRWVLADPSLPFPHNYGRLLIFMCGCMTLSTLFLAFMKEPDGAALDERQPLGRIILAIPATLRRYPPLFRVALPALLYHLCALAAGGARRERGFLHLGRHRRLHVRQPGVGLRERSPRATDCDPRRHGLRADGATGRARHAPPGQRAGSRVARRLLLRRRFSPQRS